VKTETMVFEVTDDAVEHVAAAWTAVTHSELSSLEVTAPPGWPVTLHWKVLHEETLVTVYADEDGTVPFDGVHALIEDRARRTRIADLAVDLGELGRHLIAHEGRASVQEVRETLTALWQQRSGLVQSRIGAWLQLLPVWFEPVLTLFGYRLEALDEGAVATTEAEAAYGLAAWKLTVDERTVESITRTPTRVLVLTTDFDAVLREGRAWIDNACAAASVREAIITDGTRWTTHRKRDRQLKQREWNLDHAIGIGSVDDMLNDLAEGF